MKDYTIYFLTLVLGVAIFYMFNSLESQEAMLKVSNSTREIIQLMIEMLKWVSVFVAVVLGFLIVYANNFLIKRRKKEFGLYMMLGMGKWRISGILVMETLIIGLFSLAAGIVIGVFGSQFMSVLVAKLFEADMTEFTFVFSAGACIRTGIYFGIMYAAVMIFNTFAISRYKLIDLLTAAKKNEKVKMKNPLLCVIVFVIAVIVLGYAYYLVTSGFEQLKTADQIMWPILMGIVSTFLIFWSLSGFILKLVQSRKQVYLRGSNVFVLRQIHNKINTTLMSMTIICLLLFMTISVLSAALSLNRYLTEDLKEMTPVDINLFKTANLPDNGEYSDVQIMNSRQKISDTLEENGLHTDQILKDVEEMEVYAADDWTWADSLGNVFEEVKKENPTLAYDTAEKLVRVSDYNRIARLYGITEYELEDDEYIVLCDFSSMEDIRNRALQSGETDMTIAGRTLHSRYRECKEGYILMSNSHTNTGIILVPDNCGLSEDMKEYYVLAANYNAEDEAGKEKIEDIFTNYGDETGFLDQLERKGIELDGVTKINLQESSKGVATIITFIAIYLGIIFLIASSAILALKELTESSDNRQRYDILRQIGMDGRMINQALFRQIGIFFILPLGLAVIHSIFGIQFALKLFSVQVKPAELLPSVIATAVFLVLVYGGYFLATYVGSKNIILNKS